MTTASAVHFLLCSLRRTTSATATHLQFALVALIAVTLQLAFAGCTTPNRLQAAPATKIAMETLPGASHHIRFLVLRNTSDFEDEARQSIANEQAWLAASGHSGPLPPVYFLAISGGGDSGAFTAGLLNGWTAAGTRPQFRAVTGVSTGALIAPFAFLGPGYDHVLTAVYTETSPHDIFKRRSLLMAFFGDALADTTPLRKLVARYVDRSLLDAVAAEYAKGRLLLICTVNLDTQEPVIWNMTAIAASKDPQAIELFRRIMVASAAIPGVFPPVMFDVTVDGVHYQEMHVDGGTMTQVFMYPPTFNLGDEVARAGLKRKRAIYIIRNARLDAEWASVQRRTLPIASRAISSLMQSQGVGDLYRIFATTQRDGLEYNLAFIPATFNVPRVRDFDPEYMRPLYQTGYDMALAGYPWRHEPPGFSMKVRAPAPVGAAAAH
jgi:hypothetical protein